MARADCWNTHGVAVRGNLQGNKQADNSKEIDVFRDTWIRYFGYANEVGESFRSMVPLSLVRFSYVVASGYVVADSIDKGYRANKMSLEKESVKNKKIFYAVTDCLLWQGLASVAIPGYTINRICAFSLFMFKNFTRLPLHVRKWTTTAIGLSAIPFIIKPIDRSVDFMMDKTFRTYISEDVKKETHHER